MSEDKENRRKLAKDIIAAIVTEHPELEQFTDQRSLELIHLPRLERLYQTEYYPAYRDAPSPEDFRRAIRKDFDQWDKEIADSYEAYTQAQKTPGKPISLSPSREDKDNDPRRRYLYTLFTNTLKIRFLQLTFPIMLETEAAQIITEAEGKAARLFEDWKSTKRHTIEERNPDVLADLRHRHKQHHERTLKRYLDFEGTTRLQLLSRLKFILREVKAGRDTRTNPAHLTNRLAHRMTNAQIITFLGGLVKEPEPMKAEPERLPEFAELFFNEANADKVRGLMPSNLRYWQAVCFAMATALKEKQYCPKYSKEVIARVLAAEFYGGTYPEDFRASKYTKADRFTDHRRQFYSQL